MNQNVLGAVRVAGVAEQVFLRATGDRVGARGAKPASPPIPKRGRRHVAVLRHLRGELVVCHDHQPAFAQDQVVDDVLPVADHLLDEMGGLLQRVVGHLAAGDDREAVDIRALFVKDREVQMLRQLGGDGMFVGVGLLRSRAVAVFFVETFLAVVEIHLVAGDPHLFHLRANVEDIAVGREKGRLLAGLDRAEPGAHAENLRRVQRDALERLGARQAVRGRLGGGVRQVAGVRGGKAGKALAEGHLHAGPVQDPGGAELDVVPVEVARRQGERVLENHRHIALGQAIGDLPRIASLGDDRIPAALGGPVEGRLDLQPRVGVDDQRFLPAHPWQHCVPGRHAFMPGSRL